MDYISVLVGFIFGAAITLIVMLNRTSFGTLRIDHSNLEKDIYRIDIEDLDKLSKKKVIMLTIDNNAHLSQK